MNTAPLVEMKKHLSSFTSHFTLYKVPPCLSLPVAHSFPSHLILIHLVPPCFSFCLAFMLHLLAFLSTFLCSFTIPFFLHQPLHLNTLLYFFIPSPSRTGWNQLKKMVYETNPGVLFHSFWYCSWGFLNLPPTPRTVHRFGYSTKWVACECMGKKMERVNFSRFGHFLVNS